MSSHYEKYTEGWNVTQRIDVLRAELSEEEVKGRYSQARRRRRMKELAVREHYLAPPARQGALAWQRRAIDAVRTIQKSRFEKGDALLSFWELVAHVMALPDVPVPGEETVVRFLNRMGYHAKRGRPKKK